MQFCYSRSCDTSLEYLPHLAKWQLPNVGRSLCISHLQVEYYSIPNYFRVDYLQAILHGSSWRFSENLASLLDYDQHSFDLTIPKTRWHAAERWNLPDSHQPTPWKPVDRPERQSNPNFLAPLQDEPSMDHHCSRLWLLQEHRQAAERQLQVCLVLSLVPYWDCQLKLDSSYVDLD